MYVPEGVRKIALLVNGYIVGGAVRDYLLNKPVFDYDISTPLLPDEVKEVLGKNNYHSILTGEKYGTISTFVEGIFHPIEITTFRSEKYNGTRFPEVAFHTSNQGDLMRRDFTINAIAYDPRTNEILDYNGGIQDINNKIIRFVGDAKERISDDPLRIIRACRIASTIGFNIDENSSRSIKEEKNLLISISQDRLIMETKKALNYFRSYVSNLLQYNLTEYVFGIEFESLDQVFHDARGNHYNESILQHIMDALERAENKGWTNFELLIAILFHDRGKPMTVSIDNGKTMFRTHEEESAKIFDRTMGSFTGLETKSKKQIHFLIENHMKFPLLNSKRNIIRTIIDWKIQNVPFEWIENLTNLAYADRGIEFTELLSKIRSVWDIPRPDGTAFLKYPVNKRKDFIRQIWIERAHDQLNF